MRTKNNGLKYQLFIQSGISSKDIKELRKYLTTSISQLDELPNDIHKIELIMSYLWKCNDELMEDYEPIISYHLDENNRTYLKVKV
jgi:hypothetical protein